MALKLSAALPLAHALAVAAYCWRACSANFIRLERASPLLAELSVDWLVALLFWLVMLLYWLVS